MPGAGGLSAVRDRVAPREVLREAVLYVPSPAVMDRMVLSYDALAADIYWIRAIQHYRRHAANRARRRAGSSCCTRC